MNSEAPTVLHFAALPDPSVSATLGATTRAVAGTGLRQVVVLVRTGAGRAHEMKLDPSVEVRTVDAGEGGLAGARLFASALLERSLYAVHLHGLMPCVLGSHALASSAAPPRVLYSPHGSALLKRTSALGGLLRALVARRLSKQRAAPVAGSRGEAQAVSRIMGRSAELVERSVADVFFEAVASNSTGAHLMAAGTKGDVEGPRVLARHAVLLNDWESPVRFSWLGGLPEHARERLRAANVGLLHAEDDTERAHLVSTASIFMQVSDDDEDGCLHIPEAMAAGVPCVVSDTDTHRDFIRHGENGFICSSTRDFLECTTLLLASPAERARIGREARAEAARRFSRRKFEASVLRAYGFTANESESAAGSAAWR